MMMQYHHWQNLQSKEKWKPPDDLKIKRIVKSTKNKRFTFKTFLAKELSGKRLEVYEKAKANFKEVYYENRLSTKNNLLRLEVGEGFFMEEHRDWYSRSPIKDRKFKTYNNGLLIVRVL